jgi:transposase, IS30 family
MAHVRRWHRLPASIRMQVIRMAAAGADYREIQAELGLSPGPVTRVLVPLGGVIRKDAIRCWEGTSGSGRLSLEERIEIRLGLERGWSLRQIADVLGRDVSTVSRELTRNGGRRSYRPMDAHQRAWEAARRPKSTKLASCPRLRERVVHDLERMWSPRQIQHRLRLEFGDDATMSISHETIYRSLYVQGRGELRRELTRCLRTGRAKRRPRGRTDQRGRISGMVMISERPAEVADRAVPGHWEGDLIIGTGGRSAIGTLVERTTRLVLLLHLPEGRSAAQVREAMATAIATLPASMRRSITWDQGTELALHAQFTVDTGVEVYFCDPHSPWQRGSNENTNGLLRQYFPKGTDLSVHTPDDLACVADSLNGRPRQTLGWHTPAEKYAELVATTG